MLYVHITHYNAAYWVEESFKAGKWSARRAINVIIHERASAINRWTVQAKIRVIAMINAVSELLSSRTISRSNITEHSLFCQRQHLWASFNYHRTWV